MITCCAVTREEQTGYAVTRNVELACDVTKITCELSGFARGCTGHVRASSRVWDGILQYANAPRSMQVRSSPPKTKAI
eukprot:3238435-Rhodomonas_salina.1